MTQRLCLAMLVTLGLSSGVHLTAQGAPRVLLFIRDGSGDLALMLTKEVVVMKDLLEQTGFKVDVATTTGARMSAAGITITPDLKLADVDTNRYAGVILPCMGAGAMVAPESVWMIEKAAAEGKPIAAQFNSVRVLAAAGLLVNRKYAFASNPTDIEASQLQGSTYAGDGIVTDGNIITSGICPLHGKSKGLQDGTAPLTREFIRAVERPRAK